MARGQATNPADSNCAEKLGPDYFGVSSAILQTVCGKDILLATGKGGVAIALDPDKDGKLLWLTELWETQAPSASGLVVWGGAADGARVYYPLQQPNGGLKALDIKTGKVEWNAAVEADRRGQAGPATAIPGGIFTGGWDGFLRAVSADGKVIWPFNARSVIAIYRFQRSQCAQIPIRPIYRPVHHESKGFYLRILPVVARVHRHLHHVFSAEGMAAYIAELRAQGFMQRDLDRMTKENPARLPGLPVL